MKKQKVITTFSLTFLLFMIVLLLVGSRGYIMQDINWGEVSKVEKVTATVEGEKPKAVTLPFSFQNLNGRTPVTINSTITLQQDEVIYIKNVYSLLRIYVNDELVYYFGNLENYPKFMIDPATEIFMVDPKIYGENISLRMEYESPLARDVLTVHPPMIGTVKSIFVTQAKNLGMPFLFSALQLMAGVLLILISAMVLVFEPRGKMFFWLGMFSLSTGAWGFGESNFTGLLIKNPTLLYLLAFIGLFTFSIPILHFAKSTINFKKPKPISFAVNVITVITTIALLLQLAGIVSLSKSMYFFHLLVPLTLCTLTAYTIYEAVRYKTVGAIRFIFPISVLALSSLLEVFNYQVRFTYQFASLFQMGVMFFVLFTGVTAGLYIRDMMNLRAKQKELDFEMNLMEMRMTEQKKRNLLLTENEEQIKQQRHDLRHQLTVISELANGGSEQLHSYLQNLIAEIPAPQKDYCENKAVNSIVSHYAALCKKQGIELSVHLTVPQKTEQISDSSLCIIFGNLLENAVEACNRMIDGRRFIKLNSNMQYQLLTITMDNSFGGKFTEENGKFRSSKRNEFGIGLSSIKSVAEKRGGDAEFHADGLVFLSSVYVRI